MYRMELTQEQLVDYLYHIPLKVLFEFVLPDIQITDNYTLKECVGKKYERDNCPVCLNEITDGVFTVCGHKFCGGCCDEFLKSNRCPDCRGKIAKIEVNHRSISFYEFENRMNEINTPEEMNDEIMEFIDLDLLFESRKWEMWV